jgi:fructose-specific PTS system IIA-like component
MAIRDTDKAGDAHMKIFSRLARNIMHEAFREKIRTASSKAEMVSFLCDKLGLNDG